jgi:hypothetical protein
MAAATSLIKAFKVIILFIFCLLPIQIISIYNYQGVRATAGSSSATPPTTSTTTFNQPSEVFFYLYLLSVKYTISHLFLQQQMGTSASIPSTQAPQSTSADAPQPIVAETQAKRKALTDAEAQQKRQKSTPAPISQPTDVVEQVDPPAQNISSAIIPQGPTTDDIV